MPRLSPPTTLFGRRLREARIRAGIPQDKLGVMIGMDEGSSSARISRYETGTHDPPYGIAEKLAAALRVPTAYLYSDDDSLADLMVNFSALSSGNQEKVMALIAELMTSDAAAS